MLSIELWVLALAWGNYPSKLPQDTNKIITENLFDKNFSICSRQKKNLFIVILFPLIVLVPWKLLLILCEQYKNIYNFFYAFSGLFHIKIPVLYDINICMYFFLPVCACFLFIYICEAFGFTHYIVYRSNLPCQQQLPLYFYIYFTYSIGSLQCSYMK